MKLRLQNIAVFIDNTLTVPDDAKAVVVYSGSATGKTTIAKTFFSFLTGSVDSKLLRHGSSSGIAKLELGGKVYEMKLAPSSQSVDRVITANYGEVLVFTDGTPLYTVYLSPEKLDLNVFEKKYLVEPEELKSLEAELAKIEKEVVDYSKMLEAMRTVYESTRRGSRRSSLS